jgi:hypothetical protein
MWLLVNRCKKNLKNEHVDQLGRFQERMGRRLQQFFFKKEKRKKKLYLANLR